MSVELERIYRFSASHLYRRPEWSEAENTRRFGKCARPPGHGHNYKLTLRIEGEPDALTGFVIDLGELDRLVAARVLDRLDHRHVNEAIAEFGPGGLVPSSECLVLWIRDQLLAGWPPDCRLAALRLAEDEDLAAWWKAGP